MSWLSSSKSRQSMESDVGGNPVCSAMSEPVPIHWNSSADPFENKSCDYSKSSFLTETWLRAGQATSQRRKTNRSQIWIESTPSKLQIFTGDTVEMPQRLGSGIRNKKQAAQARHLSHRFGDPNGPRSSLSRTNRILIFIGRRLLLRPPHVPCRQKSCPPTLLRPSHQRSVIPLGLAEP